MARYVRFQDKNGAAFGRVDGPNVHLLSGDILQGGIENGKRKPLSTLKLLPPSPTKVIAVGFNYRDHAEEFSTPIPETPNIFLKPVSCLTGHDAPVYYPSKLTKQVEYESELVVVVGRRARHVSRKDAAKYIFGYTIGNDVTARDLQTKTNQWALCKGFDTFGPVGPAIVTDIDPADGLEISSWVNGERKQHSSTKNLIFDVPYLIEYLSSAMTLEPGDLIFTGTPSGVGPVQPGDVMEMRIEGIGSLRNAVVQES